MLLRLYNALRSLAITRIKNSYNFIKGIKKLFKNILRL
jgi:hypothetical protein